MIYSLVEDFKEQLRYGNMVIRLILINISVFVVFTLIGVFIPGGLASIEYQNFRDFFVLPSQPIELIKKPWTLITHLFIHNGFGHIFWNMIMLFWFGRIFGDLMGDRRVLPLYLVGGLAGAIFFLVFANFFIAYGGVAMGASAAVMALVMATGFIAPNYQLYLIFIGPVKLMYIVAALFFIDLAMISQGSNTGGHFAHIGGAILGGTYIYLIQRFGFDFTESFNSFFQKFDKPIIPRQKAKVVKMDNSPTQGTKSFDTSQESVDKILEKIKKSGVKSLTQVEKDVLDKASKE